MTDTHKSFSAWLEAMRLRTLPVSVAGVLAGCACAAAMHGFSWPQALICMLFAVGAQIVSNFANEYYDFRNGLDRKGREGFRRGVTEGDISPKAMLRATYGLLAVVCLLGLSLTIWGGWWLIGVGVAVALFAIGYSTGPWPLSHHGLGDVAVLVFFGLVPVTFTAWLQTGSTGVLRMAVPVGAAIGLMAMNVLIVNNYRDADDDRAVGKNTTVVIFGRRAMSTVYLISGLAAAILLVTATVSVNSWATAAPLIYAPLHAANWTQLRTRSGAGLNIVLKHTAQAMLLASVVLLITCAL